MTTFLRQALQSRENVSRICKRFPRVFVKILLQCYAALKLTSEGIILKPVKRVLGLPTML
jgi:hypothetical protein